MTQIYLMSIICYVSESRVLRAMNSFPLLGYRVVLLREKRQGMEWADSLNALGAETVIFPVVEFQPIKEHLELITPSFLKIFTWLVFTSANAVRFFMDAFISTGGKVCSLEEKKIAAVGLKTAEVLENYGVKAHVIPQLSQAEGLVDALPQCMKNERALIPAAVGARDLIRHELKKRGALVERLNIYETVSCFSNQGEVKAGDLVVFTSPSIVHAFFNSPFYDKQPIIPFCIGNVTLKAFEPYEMATSIHVLETPTKKSLINSLIRYAEMSMSHRSCP